MKCLKHGLWALTITGALMLGFSVPAQAQECNTEDVDLVIMIDRTGSVSDSNLQGEGTAVENLLTDLLNSGNTNVHVAIGRFPGEKDGTPDDAALLSSFTTDYASLITQVDDHFVDTGSGVYEGTEGSTDLQSANQLAGDTFENDGTSTNRIYVLFSDGDPNEPVLATADADALNSANALKALDPVVHIFTIAYDASGGTSGGSNGGNGFGDVVNRNLMANMATFANSGAPRGLDGCGGNSCDGTETDLENTDQDDFFIAASGDDLDPIFEVLSNLIPCPQDNDVCTPTLECDNDTNMCVPVGEVPDECNPPPGGGDNGGEQPGAPGQPGAGGEAGGQGNIVEGTGCGSNLLPGTFNPLVVGTWLSMLMAPTAIAGILRRKRR